MGKRRVLPAASLLCGLAFTRAPMAVSVIDRRQGAMEAVSARRKTRATPGKNGQVTGMRPVVHQGLRDEHHRQSHHLRTRGLLPLSFTWQASTGIHQAASQAIELATAQIHRVKSPGSSRGALLACLAQYAAEGFLKATPERRRFASACLSAIFLMEGWTELLLVLNEHGQVIKIALP
jgi:hypothetical protein